MRRLAFQAIGTHWDIELGDMVSDTKSALLFEQIRERIDAFDQIYSRFRNDSLVTQMAQSAGRYELPRDGYRLLRWYDRLYRMTNGRVTPLIGQVMSDAGYDAQYSFTPKTIHHPPRWEEIISYDKDSLTLKRPALLDFGAAGKGYLVDLVGDIIEHAGLATYCINAGGDIRLHGPELLEVGLENPFDATEVVGIARLENASLCASAGSKRQWGDYHHIIDPETLRTTEGVVATWVMAADTMTADGIATALFFTPPEKLLVQAVFSYAILLADGSLRYSKDFPVTLFEA